MGSVSGGSGGGCFWGICCDLWTWSNGQRPEDILSETLDCAVGSWFPGGVDNSWSHSALRVCLSCCFFLCEEKWLVLLRLGSWIIDESRATPTPRWKLHGGLDPIHGLGDGEKQERLGIQKIKTENYMYFHQTNKTQKKYSSNREERGTENISCNRNVLGLIVHQVDRWRYLGSLLGGNEQPIYMWPPPGTNRIRAGLYCRLLRSHYGLKQSGRF